MKKLIFYTSILLASLTNCDSNGQTKRQQLTPEQIAARKARYLDSLNRVNLREVMKTDALYKKMEGTWTFKQIQNCDLGNCLFYGTGANGICDKLKVIFTHKIDSSSGISHVNDSYTLYYMRLPVKDGVILEDKEIGDGSQCIKNQGPYKQVKSAYKDYSFISCIGNTSNALFDDCFRWDSTKGAFYSDYTFKICGNPCHVSGYWEKEK